MQLNLYVWVFLWGFTRKKNDLSGSFARKICKSALKFVETQQGPIFSIIGTIPTSLMTGLSKTDAGTEDI